MLELIQIPWSPYCIVQRRILEFSGVPHKITNTSMDRALVWQVTRQRYYQVPVLRDGKEVLFETDENSQVIAKYLDQKLDLGLFPRRWEGVQDVLWRYFENELEAIGFKLNDIYWEDWVPPKERLNMLRHKERKFGRGCIDQWRAQQKPMVKELEQKLMVCEEMLLTRDFLLEDRPLFVDFDLFGMLGNYLYSGHYKLPRAQRKLGAWYERMASLKANKTSREKLHT